MKNSNEPIIRLQVSKGVISDETVIYVNANASNDFESYDALKMNNNSTFIPEIYTLVNNLQMAINGLSNIPYDTEIALGFTTGSAGTFGIKASQLSNFEVGTKVILKDYLDINNPLIADLSDGSSYTFSSAITSNNNSRFALVFRAPSITTGINPESNDNVWISTRNGQLVINSAGNGATLEVFNTIGQKLISKNLTGTATQTNKNLPAGVYMVKLTNEGKSITKKIIID